MKKITLSVAVLLGSIAAKSQTEYIDLTTKGIFGRSEMVVYNDDTSYSDLEYLYISRRNSNYHWVEYTNADKIVVTMSDNVGDTRELCTKRNNNKTKCEVVDAFATSYTFKASKKFQIWISKPNVK
jgi:sulfite reductase beta subunit-like hemoprotein